MFTKISQADKSLYTFISPITISEYLNKLLLNKLYVIEINRLMSEYSKTNTTILDRIIANLRKHPIKDDLYF